jgi:hypothetical protein
VAVWDAQKLKTQEGEAAKRTNGPAAEEAAGGVHAGRLGAVGPVGEKLTSPAIRRTAALRLMAERGYSR